MKEWSGLRFDGQGLIPAVVQDGDAGTVLLLGYMNREALEATIRTGVLHLWSRSRQALWRKGEQSGNFQWVDEVRVNCEADSLLVLVRPRGPACHDGYQSCFYRRLESGGRETRGMGGTGETGDTIMGATVVLEQLFNPDEVYALEDGAG
jgi:phosphoribosyl-AMP cyclohydrolase